MVVHRQATAGEGGGEVNALVQEFQKFHGQDTRQIGKFFCIPAVVSNALRILGAPEFNQYRIRDEWYAMKGRTPEPTLDEQMKGAGPDVVDALKRNTDFPNRFETEAFERPSEPSFFCVSKADEAVSFIANHVSLGHPVLVSTDSIPWEQGVVQRFCCHMWLALYADTAANFVVAHDPATDILFRASIEMSVPVQMGSTAGELEIGLRGRITTTNYFCLAFWKR